jgi:adenosylcobinamide-phosphate synthase
MAIRALFGISAMLTGYLFDLAVGDPVWFPHMVRLMGGAIRLTEGLIRPLCKNRPGPLLLGGTLMAALIGLGSYLGAAALIKAAEGLHALLGFGVMAFLAYQSLATRDLIKEGRAVAQWLEQGDLEGARRQVGRIVGRDTAALDEAGVVRATVETLAENLSDGIGAPMFYGFMLGVPGAVFYKAVNTLDSMVGYKNSRYLYFGRASARLDDVLNFLPARLSALCLVAVCPIMGLSAGRALHILRRDGGNHTSPNSGRTEAAMAGALGIELGGGSAYEGLWVDKPTLGDALYPPGVEHIHVACTLVWLSSLLMAGMGALAFLVLEGWVRGL